MTDKIRVGIVGATVTQGGSGWGANAHVPALKALPHYELKAVCTSHEDTAKASAAAFGAERAFHRFSDMAADPDVDLIVVCVRVPGHRDLVLAGLQAGKAVFCEWPLGANLAEAEEMAGLASQRSMKSIVGLQARSDPTILYAADLVQGGYIGDVLTANLSTVAQARRIIAAVGSDNLFLQMDFYHCQVTEGDLAEKIRANLGLIRHFQIAGNPGRHEPDVGEVHYPYLFDLIDELGYKGSVGCEYRPRGETVAGLGWARRYGISLGGGLRPPSESPS